MIKAALFAAALTGVALAEAPDTAGWRAEPYLAGIEHASNAPTPEPLNAWRNDGGLASNPALMGLIIYSTADRIGVSAQVFVRNEPDGAVVWRVFSFASYPADREKAHVIWGCGPDRNVGTSFETMNDRVQYLGIMNGADIPVDEVFTGLTAAAKIDLQTGAIEPISPKGVFCRQEFVD